MQKCDSFTAFYIKNIYWIKKNCKVIYFILSDNNTADDTLFVQYCNFLFYV